METTKSKCYMCEIIDYHEAWEKESELLTE